MSVTLLTTLNQRSNEPTALPSARTAQPAHPGTSNHPNLIFARRVKVNLKVPFTSRFLVVTSTVSSRTLSMSLPVSGATGAAAPMPEAR